MEYYYISISINIGIIDNNNISYVFPWNIILYYIILYYIILYYTILYYIILYYIMDTMDTMDIPYLWNTILWNIIMGLSLSII